MSRGGAPDILDVVDVLVVGGGIIGLSCARELAAAGLQVEVVERLPSGSAASHAAAGMLTALGDEMPAEFVGVCRESRDLWPAFLAALEEESGRPIEHDDLGALVLALSEDEAVALDAYVAEVRSAGEEVYEISLDELRRRVPDASPATRRVLHLPGERRVDNVQVCEALATAAERRGVRISYGCEVERVEIAPNVLPDATTSAKGVVAHCTGGRREARLLLLTAGAWSGSIPGLPPLSVRPVRGQIVRLAGVSWPWRGIVRDREHYAVRRGEGSLLVGSTLEEAGFAAHVTEAGVRELLDWARHLFPALASAPIEAVWAGLRPATPDAMPIIGRPAGPLPGLPVLVATGHHRNGILLAPWTAREVARLVTTGADGREIFSPARFRSSGPVATMEPSTETPRREDL
ncbi:MAG TPA: glycine oxidase ThiO [Thermoanaerobaculia bacterium]